MILLIFLYTKTYGVAPSNTTITVQYLVGGGAESNIAANTLSLIASNNITFFGATLDATLKSTVQDSLAFNNPSPAIGGGDGDTNQDLRENVLSQYSSQLRTVTKEDYIIRSLSLPSKFGVIAKSYVTKENDILAAKLPVYDEKNDNALSLHILSKDSQGI